MQLLGLSWRQLPVEKRAHFGLADVEQLRNTLTL